MESIEFVRNVFKSYQGCVQIAEDFIEKDKANIPANVKFYPLDGDQLRVNRLNIFDSESDAIVKYSILDKYGKFKMAFSINLPINYIIREMYKRGLFFSPF